MRLHTIIRLLLLFLLSSEIATAQGFIMAVGGGSESNTKGSWSEEPYSWFVEKAHNHTITVLSYDAINRWIPDYFKSLGAVYVYDLSIKSSSLNQIVEALRKSSGVFLKGGDQRDYIYAWKGTDVIKQMERIYQAGGVIGGTSAGAMILGEFASTGGPYSYENLEDPFNSYNGYQRNFLSFLPNIVFDTHYFERGRMGRLLGFLARMQQESNQEITGIGIDDRTAVLIQPDGKAMVKGSGGVHVLRGQIRAERRKPLLGSGIALHQLVNGFSFDLHSLEILEWPETAILRKSTLKQRGYGREDFRTNLISETVFDKLSSELGGFSNWVIVGNGDYSSLEAKSEQIRSVRPTSLSEIELSENAHLFFDIPFDSIRSIRETQPSFFEEAENKSVMFHFSIEEIEKTGEWYSTNVHTKADASFKGEFNFSNGAAITPGVIVNQVFADSDFAENRSTIAQALTEISSEVSFMVLGTGMTSLTLDAKKSKQISAWTRNGTRRSPAILIEIPDETYVCRSPFSFGRNPRHAVSFTHALVSIIPSGEEMTSEVIVTSSEFDSKELKTNRIEVLSAFPNPFNPSTQVQFLPNQSGKTTLSVYSVLGKLVKSYQLQSVGNQVQLASVSLDENSSGVYFIQIVNEGQLLGSLAVTLMK